MKNKLHIINIFVIAMTLALHGCQHNTTHSKAIATQETSTTNITQDKKQHIKDLADKSGDIGIDCPADPDWFPHQRTQRTNDAQFASSSNCEFHQWAWQNFLWLTQDVNDHPRFMSFASPESLLNMSTTGMLPRTSKSDTHGTFNEYLQAGTSGIFVAHNNRALYYSQYLDHTYVDFVVSNDLTNPQTLYELISEKPETTFPISGLFGAMELKVSWMIVEDNDDVSDMFTTETEIAQLTNYNGQIIIDKNKTEKVTVALVGFHIAGVVKGHPEMIWATFEHKKNAPNVTPELSINAAVSDLDYTFYTANTPLSECNINASASHQLTLDEETQKLSPVTQACRQYQYGNQQGINSINDKNIASINSSILPLFEPTDVWKNYHEVGAIWFKGTDEHNTLRPGLSLQTNALLSGSISLSNSTIETFTQLASTENNCFRCHNTLQQIPQQQGLKPLPASNLNISHALMNIYFWSQNNTATLGE